MSFLKYLATNRTLLLVGAIGVVLGSFIAYTLFIDTPVTDQYSTDYHTHADFLIYLRGEHLNLGASRYMTSAEQSLHHDVHLHDGVGDVVHFHAPDITFSEFISSLGYTLTNDCFITQSGEQFCAGEVESLQLFVNDTLYQGDISSYVPEDLDRILIHYGSISDERIPLFLEAVKDEACIYSGSCPERGTAPAESCGLTCEL